MNSNWFFSSDAGLALRIGIGLTVLACLGVYDVKQHGREARRWKEYAVLAACAALAMAYGAINDLITSSFSWEFFYYGKDLAKVLGPATPPALAPLYWEAAKVGIKASWTAGLIAGVALLIANNPRQGWRRLSYRELMMIALPILLFAAIGGIIGAGVGYAGTFDGANEDFRGLVQDNLWRPRRFIAAWGANLGGYVGSAVGIAVAILRVVFRRRKRLMNTM